MLSIRFHWQFSFYFRKWSSTQAASEIYRIVYMTLSLSLTHTQTHICIYIHSEYRAKLHIHRQYCVYSSVKCHISGEAFPSICSWKIQILLKICINLYVVLYNCFTLYYNFGWVCKTPLFLLSSRSHSLISISFPFSIVLLLVCFDHIEKKLDAHKSTMALLILNCNAVFIF